MIGHDSLTRRVPMCAVYWSTEKIPFVPFVPLCGHPLLPLLGLAAPSGSESPATPRHQTNHTQHAHIGLGNQRVSQGERRRRD